MENGKFIDASRVVDDYNEDFFSSRGLETLRDWVKSNGEHASEVPKTSRLGPPVARPSKIICIGLNYVDHAKESGMKTPCEPVVFFKATSAFSGPDDNLVIPKGSKKTDWEVELAVVISKRANYIKEEEASNYIAGYMLHNDYSEREWQLERSGQWVKGKSADSFAPLGPWMVTPEEFSDINNLRLWLKVNGQLKQNGNTENLIFKIPFLISYLSQFMSLLPGDVISTGTPAGVGFGLRPPQYLRKGDVVELGIDGLGVQKQIVH